MLLRALLMLLGHAGAWILAFGLLRRCRTGTRSGDLVGVFALHAFVVSFLSLLVGSLHVIGIGGFLGAGLAAGAAGVWLGGLPLARELVDDAREAARAIWREQPLVAGSCAFILGLIALRHAFNVWFVVPYTGDEHEYHLPRLAYWMQTGGIALPDLLDTRSYFPAGQQLMQLWWVGFLHHDGLIEGAALESAVWAGLSCFALARRLGAAPAGALLASTVFLTVPAILIHATCSMNDLGSAACVLSAVALAVNPAAVRESLLLAAMSLALGAGIKPTAIFASSGALLLGLLAWRKRGEGKLAAGTSLLLIFACVVGGYWYFMNAAAFGNPVYPVKAFSGGEEVAMGVGSAAVSSGPSIGRLAANLSEIFGSRMWNWHSSLDPRLDNTTGWGWIVPMLGFPVLGWLAATRREWRILALASFLSLVSTLLLVVHDSWNARFVMWVPALAAVAIGVLWPSLHRFTRWALVAALLGGGLMNIVETAVSPLLIGWRLERLVQRPFSQRDGRILALEDFSGDYRRMAMSDDPVLCMTFNFQVYALAGGDYRRWVDHAVITDAVAIVDRMKSSGCPLLLIANPTEEIGRAVDVAVAKGWLRREAAGWYRLIAA